MARAKDAAKTRSEFLLCLLLSSWRLGQGVPMVPTTRTRVPHLVFTLRADPLRKGIWLGQRNDLALSRMNGDVIEAEKYKVPNGAVASEFMICPFRNGHQVHLLAGKGADLIDLVRRETAPSLFSVRAPSLSDHYAMVNATAPPWVWHAMFDQLLAAIDTKTKGVSVRDKSTRRLWKIGGDFLFLLADQAGESRKQSTNWHVLDSPLQPIEHRLAGIMNAIRFQELCKARFSYTDSGTAALVHAETPVGTTSPTRLCLLHWSIASDTIIPVLWGDEPVGRLSSFSDGLDLKMSPDGRFFYLWTESQQLFIGRIEKPPSGISRARFSRRSKPSSGKRTSATRPDYVA